MDHLILAKEGAIMKRLILCVSLSLLGMAPAMFADVVDYMLNVNGTTFCPSGTAATCSANTGFAGAGATGSLDTSFNGTGLGTVNLTFNPGAPGSYNVDLWLFEELVPASGYDEYGATGGGSPAGGVSWQIDTPDYDYPSDPNFGGLPAGAGTIVANAASNSLSNTNYIPGTTDNFLNNCPLGPSCNDFTSIAFGQNFTLGANQQELLSFTVSTTAPTSGFYLEQIDPGITGTSANYFYSVTASTQSVCPVTADCNPVPEPRSIIPLLAFVGVLGLALWRRSAAV
jgi:hypothetical protein